MYWIEHFSFLGTILTVKSQLIYGLGLGLGYRIREPNKKIKADRVGCISYNFENSGENKKKRK